MTMERIQDYQIRDFIAPGGTSAVFAALRRNPAIQTPWRVAVKIVWDIGLARHEAENLVALNDSRGVVNLMDYFELPYRMVAPYLDEMPAQAGSTYTATTVERDFKLEDETVVGCLVLQFLAGTPLVKQTIAVDEQEEQEYDDAISVKDLESGVWLKQTLAFQMDLEQRLDFLIQLADYIEDCHRTKIVHGDLKPQNILYNTDNQKVTILDFGGSTEITRGSPGWQAPEHFKFVLGELPQLPLSTDVFLLGLFIHRFLASAKIDEVPTLVAQCLTEPDKRISAGVLKRELQALQKRLFAPKRRALSGAALAIILVLIGVIFYQFTRPPEEVDPLVKKYGHDDGASLVERAKEIGKQPIEDIYQFLVIVDEVYNNDKVWPELKMNAAKSKATVRSISNPSVMERTFDFTSVNFVKYAPSGNYIKSTNRTILFGYFVKNQYYLEDLKIESDGYNTFIFKLRNLSGEYQEVITSPFPYMSSITKPGFVFFKDIYLRDLLQFFARDSNNKLVVEYPEMIPVSGFVSFDNNDELFNFVLRNTVWETKEDVIHVVHSKRKEIYFSHLPYLQFNKGREYKEILEWARRVAPMPVEDPHNLLEGKELAYTINYSDVNFQYVLEEVLEMICLQPRLENGVIVIEEMINPNDF